MTVLFCFDLLNNMIIFLETLFKKKKKKNVSSHDVSSICVSD